MACRRPYSPIVPPSNTGCFYRSAVRLEEPDFNFSRLPGKHRTQTSLRRSANAIATDRLLAIGDRFPEGQWAGQSYELLGVPAVGGCYASNRQSLSWPRSNSVRFSAAYTHTGRSSIWSFCKSPKQLRRILRPPFVPEKRLCSLLYMCCRYNVLCMFISCNMRVCPMNHW